MEPEDKKRYGSRIFTFVGIFSIVLLAVLFTRTHYKNKETSLINEALKDSLELFVDENGNQRGRIMTLSDLNSEYLLSLESKDSSIMRLQKALRTAASNYNIEEPGSTVAVLDTETNINTTVPTEVIKTDNDIFPIYTSKFNLDGWVYGKVLAKNDSTTVVATVKDEFDFVLGYEDQGLFKKSIPYSDVTSKNPYSQIKTFRTYQVEAPPPDNIIIGPSITYGLGANLTFQPVFGVSITYKLVGFRL